MVRPDSLRQKIYELWVKNPYITAKKTCENLQLTYSKHGNYINRLLSEFRSYHQFASPEKAHRLEHRVFEWHGIARVYKNGDEMPLEIWKVGWRVVANRGEMWAFRDPRGTVHWYQGGLVRLYLKGEVQLAKAKELFCRAFSWFTNEQLKKYLDIPLKEVYKKWIFDLGQPVPRFDIRTFERSHGLRIFTDGSHPTCFVPGTFVVTQEGLERIENVPIGTLVLSHKGVWRRVMRVFCREYTGPVYEIKPYNGLTIKVTPEHPVFATDCRKGLKAGRWRHLDWIPVSQLTKKHYLAFPLLSRHVIPTTWVRFYGKGTNNSKICSEGRSHFSTDIYRLIGYYIGDGSGYKEIHIDFSLDEETQAHDVKTIVEQHLKRSCRIYHNEEKHAICVVFSHVSLMRWLKENVGLDAWSKTMPLHFLHLPTARKVELFRGLRHSDGSSFMADSKHLRYSYTTVSKNLAIRVSMLLHSLGIIASISRRERNTGYGNAPCFVVNVTGNTAHKLARLLTERYDYSKTNRTYSLSFFSGRETKRFVMHPIKSIETSHYSGKVYNLEVEVDDSYTTPFAIWHNCLHVGESVPFWIDEQRQATQELGTVVQQFGVEIGEHMKLIKIWQQEAKASRLKPIERKKKIIKQQPKQRSLFDWILSKGAEKIQVSSKRKEKTNAYFLNSRKVF